ncbi:hypothetical protein D9M71_755440 [compost metagenome]
MRALHGNGAHQQMQGAAKQIEGLVRITDLDVPAEALKEQPSRTIQRRHVVIVSGQQPQLFVIAHLPAIGFRIKQMQAMTQGQCMACDHTNPIKQ